MTTHPALILIQLGNAVSEAATAAEAYELAQDAAEAYERGVLEATEAYDVFTYQRLLDRALDRFAYHMGVALDRTMAGA